MSVNLPANLPSVARAKLPVVYESARTALAECSRIDECKDWADKAEALASYAKQANDDALRHMADKIQARAIRRCGELLGEIDKSSGGRPPKTTDGTVPSSRKAAARDAGLSERQSKTALRVARIPEAEFESAVESDDPPTVTQLAERGTVKAQVNLHGRLPQNFQAATATLGWLRSIAEFCERNTPAAVVAGLLPKELKRKKEISAQARAIAAWLKRMDRGLQKENA